MNIISSLIIIIILSKCIMVSKYSNFANGEAWCIGAPDGQVYLFDGWDFNGDRYTYNVSQGKMKLPEKFINNVQSFTSGSNICFFNCGGVGGNNESVTNGKVEYYQITTGQSHRNYAALTNFGQRMDTVIPGNCNDAINNSPCIN